MIRGLRSTHRRIWMALALLLPLGFGAALAVRPRLPREDPDALGPALGPLPPEARGAPDVLVYASATGSIGETELPADARLLGPAGELPAQRPRGASLFFYSLAQRRVIARVPAGEPR
jgi:hypothetical protein